MAVETVEVNFLAKEYGDIFGDGISAVYSWRRKRKKQEHDMPEGDASTGRPLKVLAINACPEKEKGDIAGLLGPYLEGIKSAGADVELYYSRDLTVFPCCGNLNCTVRTPGDCMAHDDMRWLRRKIGRADVLVLASPRYFRGITGPEGATGPLRSLLMRLVPGRQAPAEAPYEHAVHTTKEAANLRKVVFVSGCGFWEIEGLYPALTHIKALCNNSLPDFSGCITAKHGVLLDGAFASGMAETEVSTVARQSGYRLGLGGRGPPVARERLTRNVYGRIMAGKPGEKKEEYYGQKKR